VPVLLNADQLTAFLHGAFPDGHQEDRMRVESVTDDAITMRMRIDAANLRPGATVSGPTIFSLVDAAAWLITVAHLGEGRDAVTSSVTIHYLRRPAPADLRAEGRLLKLGRRLSITDVLVHSEGIDAPVAHATVTYAPV
jgi:uncharacterized protein (TIGR00369 family)